MTAVDVLDKLTDLGITATAAGQKLLLAPGSKVPASLLPEIKEHKTELLELVSTSELIDLPWPIGYGGLPADEVAKAEFSNDRLGVTDPVERRLNVLMWMRQHFLSKGDPKMAAEMKVAYLELRNADPDIERLVSISGQSLDDLLKRLRAGSRWLMEQHQLWLQGSPEADSSYGRALAAWSELEEDTRQKYSYRACIFGVEARCPEDAPARCDGCRGQKRARR